MSLALLAERALARTADAPLLGFEDQLLTGADVAARSARTAGRLAALGVKPGDRVALVMTNQPEVVLLYLAVWRAGAAITPLVPAVTAAELRHVLLDSGATVLLVSADRTALAAEATEGLPVQVLVAGPDLEDADPLPLVPRSGDDLAALLYTGGTTGRAKGVMLGHRGLVEQSAARAEVLERSGTRGTLVPLPLSHVFGLMTTVSRLHLEDPGVLRLQRRFVAAEWLRLVAEHRVEAGALVPSMLQLLLREPLEDADLSSLRYLSTGGAPLAVTVVEEFERRVPGVVVCDGYGCTEVTSTATMNPPWARRLGSVGLPLPRTSLRVVADDGTVLPAGKDGEVCVRSPGVMLGYWRDPAATVEVVRDGWLHTGDVGHLDDDGYLFVVDRLKDLVIRGGFNVYPRDVEDVLLAHPAVATAAVVGRPDEVYGEEVVAYVGLRPGAAATVEELLAHCAANLSAVKRPRELHVLDDVPLTSVGKTDRKALRLRARGGA
ncbi:MAG: AMP-dependent synthetase and ligase [Frankiales bacterium]|nr:AMP-dependent synthetase and ligase [Frankiales bacterium]